MQVVPMTNFSLQFAEKLCSNRVEEENRLYNDPSPVKFLSTISIPILTYLGNNYCHF